AFLLKLQPPPRSTLFPYTTLFRSLRIDEGANVVPQLVVDCEREQLRIVTHAPQQIAHLPRAVADRIAAMGRGNPLVDHHRPEVQIGRAHVRRSSPEVRGSRLDVRGSLE